MEQKQTHTHSSSGDQINVCDNFKYLGVNILDPEQLFADRRRLAWIAAQSLRSLFNSPASDTTKLRLFRAVVESVLLYGLEAVPMTDTRENIINRSHRCLMRFALGIHYPDLIPSDELYARTRVSPLNVTLRQRRLMLTGHVLREDARHIVEGESRTPLALMLAYPPIELFRRGMGRLATLRQTYITDLQAVGLALTNVHTVDKKTYRQMVLSV